jgi:hypothetical protein
MAISPDGTLITIADDFSQGGGAKVFSVTDGTIVGRRAPSGRSF